MQMFFYTDGSKEAKLVGCAVTSLACKLSNKVCCSIFSAELKAIPLAMQHITQNSLQCGAICFNLSSDIQKFSSTRQLHRPIVNAIREPVSSQQLTLKLIWTQSHCNIPDNELADSGPKRLQNSSLHHWNQQLMISSTPLENMYPKTGIQTEKTCQKATTSDTSNQCRALGAYQCKSLGSYIEIFFSGLRLGHIIPYTCASPHKSTSPCLSPLRKPYYSQTYTSRVHLPRPPQVEITVSRILRRRLSSN